MAKHPPSLKRVFVVCRRCAQFTLTRPFRIPAVLVVVAGLVTTFSLAYASPADLTWIGVYDADDFDADHYDDAVRRLVKTSGVCGAAEPMEPLTTSMDIAERICCNVDVASYPIVPGRSPPDYRSRSQNASLRSKYPPAATPLVFNSARRA